jgi:pantothenate synthetase
LVDAEARALAGVLDRPAALCVAAFFGSVRLIDNVMLAPA